MTVFCVVAALWFTLIWTFQRFVPSHLDLREVVIISGCIQYLFPLYLGPVPLNVKMTVSSRQ